MLTTTCRPLVPLLVVLLLVTACRSRRLSPEEQIRRTLAEVEKAVEDKDLDEVGTFISERYRDDQQNDRAAIKRLVQIQFFRYPNIHLFLRVGAVDVDAAAGQAHVTVYAAMGSVAMANENDLARVNADLYRFNLKLAEEEKATWRLQHATWSPARLSDYLPTQK